jgi:hypothetical protein
VHWIEIFLIEIIEERMGKMLCMQQNSLISVQTEIGSEISMLRRVRCVFLSSTTNPLFHILYASFWLHRNQARRECSKMINPAIQLIIIENLTFKKTYDNFFLKLK